MSSIRLPVVALFAALSFAGVWGAAGAPAAAPSCLVSNDRTGTGFRSLQPAVDAAAAGDTLVVKGTCDGSTTIGKSLALKGVANNPFGVPTLDGSGSGSPVLTVSFSGSVAIVGLTITHGSCGILALGRLTLSRASVLDNDGCGIDGFMASIVLTDSTVSGNTGNGIDGQAGVTLTRSIIEDNGGDGIRGSIGVAATDSAVSDNGGDGISVGSPSSIGGSTISGNHGVGVGIFDASLTMTTSIVRNNAGGGVASGSGTVGLIRDSTITGNTTSGSGGGIAISPCTSTLCVSLVRVTVTGNTAAGDGGGIYATGGFSLEDSTVSGNTATSGGGIFFSPVFPLDQAILIGTNAFLDNVPNDCVGVSGC